MISPWRAGPPHKGKLLEPGTPESILAEPARYAEVCDGIVRGIELAARLRAEPSSSPGWLRVSCRNHIIAEWLLRAITMENVSVRLEENAILLPAGPAFRVEREIKNVITVTAKTTHYWSGHLIRLQQLGIANLFDQLDSVQIVGPLLLFLNPPPLFFETALLIVALLKQRAHHRSERFTIIG